MLNQTDVRLLRLLTQLQDPENPANVEALAEKMRVTPSFISQRLGRLEREGLVERRLTPAPDGRRGRFVHYFAKPSFSVQWVSRSEGIAIDWDAATEIDWSFPLISQVKDEPARLALKTLLAELREAQLLDPWERKSTVLKGKRHQFLGLSVIAFGSTARGPARPGADLDLLFVHDEPNPKLAEKAKDVADEVSVKAPRPIQVKHLTLQQLFALPEPMRASIQTEGLIVYDGLRSKRGGETRQLWKLVYGGRSRG